MEQLFEVVVDVIVRLIEVVRFPLDPENRIYWLYLVTSVIAAFAVYRAIRAKGSHATAKDAEAARGSFLQFLFPRSVWSHPSAWLDLRYLIFHKTVSHFLLLGIGTSSVALGYYVVSGGQSLVDVVHQGNPATLGGWVVAFVFMFVAIALLDFVAWALHYLQHRVPLLWQFHKVHHSAEVMHPISNFREHPIDNLTYGFFIGLGYGMVYAATVRLLGMLPTAPTLLGVPLLAFLF
ncbi:MAG: sterol desaturase family protein, partial [Pseudomonadota bacterium]